MSPVKAKALKLTSKTCLQRLFSSFKASTREFLSDSLRTPKSKSRFPKFFSCFSNSSIKMGARSFNSCQLLSRRRCIPTRISELVNSRSNSLLKIGFPANRLNKTGTVTSSRFLRSPTSASVNAKLTSPYSRSSL